MTVNAITDTKKGRTGIAPTYLHTTRPFDQLLVGLQNAPIFTVLATLNTGAICGRPAPLGLIYKGVRRCLQMSMQLNWTELFLSISQQ